jgi:hypothetical protein
MNLVRTGQWRAARSYVVGFVPSDDPMSDEATLLLLFLQDLLALRCWIDLSTNGPNGPLGP